MLKEAEKKGIEPFSLEEYQQMKKGLKSRKAPDTHGGRYEMVKYAGEDLDNSTLTMINELTTNGTCPTE